MSEARAVWRERLMAILLEAQPELEGLALSDELRLGEDLGLDSFAFEALFAALKRELPAPVPLIAWYNALEAGEGRVGVLLDLIEAHGGSPSPGLRPPPPGAGRTSFRLHE